MCVGGGEVLGRERGDKEASKRIPVTCLKFQGVMVPKML